MQQDEFVRAVREAGFDLDVWLVFEEDRHESIAGGGFRLSLRRAFWKRGEAYAFAARAHARREWHHFYVFRLAVDVLWAAGAAPRRVEFEAVFEDARDFVPIEVTPAQVATVFEAPQDR